MVINENRLKEIGKIHRGSASRLREKYFFNNYQEIYLSIINFTKELDISFIQRIWHWVNDMPNYFTCKCGEKTSFNRNWLDGYRKFCSAKCAQTEDSVKYKRKVTTNKKYGVDNISQLDSIKEKTINTNINKYGTKSTFQNEEVRNKWKETIKIKYGVDHYFKTDEFKIKTKNTNIEKYGTEHYVQSEHYLNKLINIGFSDKLRLLNFEKMKFKFEKLGYSLINYKDRILTMKSSKCGHVFDIFYDTFFSRLDSEFEVCMVCEPKNTGQSKSEKKIIDWINGLGLEYREKDRSFGVEIDIFLPEINIGIEFNGLYWHSELYKDKYSHLKKTLICNQNGVELIHIWEDDWIYKKDIIESILLYRFKLIQNKIFARNCDIRVVNPKDKDDFLNFNHIQGKCKSFINIGLYYNNELVSIMCFNHQNSNINKDIELVRFCNKKYTIVTGSASKLFNFFINTNTNINKIISFADLSNFQGNIYNLLNFKKGYITKPNYWWVVDRKRYHRFRFSKKKLVKQGHDPLMTEVEIMHSLGNYRIYGCGQEKWIWDRNI
jgi:hypothetical protein